MTVYKPGSKVQLGDIPATIESVTISESDRIEYTVVWWSNGSRYCECVSAFEVEGSDDSGRLDIGFV